MYVGNLFYYNGNFRILKPSLKQASSLVLALCWDQKIAELIAWHCGVVKNGKTTGSLC